MNFIKSDPNNNSPLSTNSSKGENSTEEEQDKGDLGTLQVAGIPYKLTEEDNTDLGGPPTCSSKAMIFVQRVSRFVSPFLQ